MEQAPRVLMKHNIFGWRPHTIHAVIVASISIASLSVYSARMPDITQDFWNDNDTYAAFFNGLFDCIGSILAFMILPRLGKYSDTRGRKPMMILAMISCALPLWMLCISETFDPDLLWFFYLARVFGNVPVTAFSFSYVTDVAPVHLRSRHFGYVMWGLFLGVLLGPGLYLALPGELSFYVVGLIAILSLPYIYYIVPESVGYKDDEDFLLPGEETEGVNLAPEPVKDNGPPKDLKGIQEETVPLSQAFRYLFTHIGRRPVAIVYLFSSFTTRGLTDVWGLYLKNYLHMDDGDLGLFTIGVGLSGGFGLGLVYPILIKFIGLVTVLKISLASAIFGNLLFAAVQNKDQVPIVYFFQVFQYMVLPICNSLLCAQVPVEDYGMAIGSLSGIGQFSNAAGPALLSALYSLFTAPKLGISFPKGIFMTGIALAGTAFIASFFIPKKLNARGAAQVTSSLVTEDLPIEEDEAMEKPLIDPVGSKRDPTTYTDQ